MIPIFLRAGFSDSSENMLKESPEAVGSYDSPWVMTAQKNWIPEKVGEMEQRKNTNRNHKAGNWNGVGHRYLPSWKKGKMGRQISMEVLGMGQEQPGRLMLKVD